MDITEFYQTFFEEADELLAEMELLLLGLDLQAPDSEHLNAIFRAAHSIKGGAATFGFLALTDTTHLLENLLDRARHGQLTLSTKMMDAFLETKDVLQKQMSAYRAGAEPEPDMVARICAVLRQLAQEAGAEAAPLAAAAPPAQPVPPLVAPPDAAAPAAGSTLKVHISKVQEADRRLLGEELGNLGRVLTQTQTDDSLTLWLDTTCDADDIIAVCCFIVDTDQIHISTEPPAAAAAAVEMAPAAAPVAAPPAVSAAAASAGTAGSPKAAPPAAAASAPGNGKESNSIRVDVEKVDQIINLVGELVITQSMLTQTAAALDPVLHERLLSGMGHLERNARDLQESVMSIRMMPMDYVFSRFPRLIRDLSGKLGKQVQLVTVGKETELDKSLIERIIDPITHLVRNSLDHGIEGPEQRARAGKDPMGRLTLSAQHQGGSIVIEVKDDGGGLSREKILAKALQKGMAISETITDDEVWQLIFAPGFSTAEEVTDISGRGVGMDVVKRNIHEMGGHVEIASMPGKGSVIKIVLPLTLAILNGMSVKVGKEIYILPLNYVIESLQPQANAIHMISADEQVMHVRGEYLSLVELHKFFDIPDAVCQPTEAIAVIVQAEGTRFALLVDQLVGQHQVVVKNLETNYRKVPGISAATILGDGNVALIIDVAAMKRANREKASMLA
ncbi:MAG: chemotaxis protein CheA [Rhodoferax sp.]|uniref:chemotaxis protein CheA n=5 Tax=Rhodoferax sp. TaxID=50421 RepID=UPI0027301847|nr:chemotaxis protein CheA [Rhodoferax sp.]MDP1530402.1 chemotaxis protein CheA [Rhodoferax sp.]MDP1943252.1 chemotaxis protein CheA [Rhodoferax sp.]MDP2442704.1 chemotaxis protein CheA [Rhodoferax sp.]MDP3191970.1 chemotaxis protein CheA [Rhodoferax sp.]MDP3865404.1 chemotaxis protein CheA [Rhodoferax sp.]